MKWPAVVLLAVMAGTATYFAAKHMKADPVEAEFESFIAKYGKVYTKEERESRFATFRNTYAFIMAENAKGHKYKLAVNEFADMGEHEFATTHFGQKKPKEMWGALPHLGTHEYSGAPLPKSVDWSTKGAVTPIKNQQQCGSCWSFSTTGSIEGAWEIASGKLVSLSEQQFVDCSSSYGNQGCNGGLMDDAFQYAEKNALCTEESYPYLARAGPSCKASSCTVGIPSGGITGYKDVKKEDLQSMEEAVALGPVSIAIQANQAAFQSYHSGVLTADCGTQLDHGVLVVGYGTLDGTDYWKVKNSWGPSWGQQGFILLEKNKNAAGECGLKMSASYPVVNTKPGPAPPSPPPAPPAPTPPPSPPTPGGASHYEKPPCRSDETQASVQGANGAVCAPKCDASGGCPTDTPAGTKDKPKCLLQDQSGNKYCALTCLFGGCPTGAKCAHIGHIGIMGICVYPSGKQAPEFMLHKIPEEVSVSLEISI